jgi:hypothetical protein
METILPGPLCERGSQGVTKLKNILNRKLLKTNHLQGTGEKRPKKAPLYDGNEEEFSDF